MRYVEARFEFEKREKTYRIYATDCLYAIANRGLTITKRYADILFPEPEKPEDTRTPEEIVASIWKNINKGGESKVESI